MEDWDRINYLAARNGLDPNWVRDRLAKGLPLKVDPSGMSADWDDVPPFEALPRWRRIEGLPDGYMG